MKKFTTLLFIMGLIFSCQTEKLDLDQQEANASKLSLHSNSNDILRQCKVIDLDRCDLPGFTTNFWWPESETNWEQGLFHQDDNNKLTFTEYNDGTASILGSTVLGTCIVTVDVWLKEKKTWDVFTNAQNGGSWKDENNDCTDADPTALNYYQIDSAKSTISASADCAYGAGETFGVEQRPDPLNGTDGDPSTYRLGAPVGPGAGLFDAANKDLDGLSTWGWLTKNGVRQYIIDFNFNLECEPTVEECFDCDGNVTELKLQYNGDVAADIVVETKDEGVNGSKVVFEGNVAPGGMFTILGNDENGTLGEEIKVYVDGDYVKIKTDCSEAIGPGLIIGNIEVISGASHNGGNLCPIPCDECKGGVTSFTFEYTGDSPAMLKVEDKNKVLFAGEVTPGQSITLEGSKDDGKFEENNLIFTLNDVPQSAPGHDNDEIHMSCSKPFYVGLPIGDSLVVTAGYSKDNGPICPIDIDSCDECKGGVTSITVQYTGNTSAPLMIFHKEAMLFNEVVTPGQMIMVSGSKDDGKFEENDLVYKLNGVAQSAPGHENGKIHMSCSRPFYVGLPIGDELIVTAGTSKDNGPVCEDTPECKECDGGVTSFTFKYTGDNGATLKVEHKNAVLFNDIVNTGDMITLKGSKDDGKFEENNLIFTLNGMVQSAPGHDNGEIHMSCSKPFYPGLPIGDNIVITSGTSKENYAICEDTPPVVPDCLECKGGVTSFVFKYTGANGATLKVALSNAVLFNEVVSTDQMITLNGSKDDGKFEENNLIFTLNGMVQSAPGHDTGKIHMSCSKPFYVGLPIGDSIIVVSGTSKDNGAICEETPPTTSAECDCNGKIIAMSVVYGGANGANVTVGADENGNNSKTFTNVQTGDVLNAGLGDIGNWWYWSVNGNVQAAIHTSCSDTILGNVDAEKSTFGNSGAFPDPVEGDNNGTFLVVSHTDDSNNTCTLEDYIDLVEVPQVPVACDCDGKIVAMSVVYGGPNGATVTVGADENGNNSKTFPNVQTGDVLNAGLGDIGNWWYWSVDGNVQAGIHTSCSDTILGNVDAEKSTFGNSGTFPDPVEQDNNGTFLVVSHTDDSNNTCTLDGYMDVVYVPEVPVACDCDGKIVEMIVVYSGPNGVEITVTDEGGNNAQRFTDVQSGDILPGSIGNVGNWWHWSINGTVEARIHTSCSDDILGNVDAEKSYFGNLGTYPDPADVSGSTNNGTFLVVSHTDENGNTCSILTQG